jgi:hypothetical protein
LSRRGGTGWREASSHLASHPLTWLLCSLVSRLIFLSALACFLSLRLKQPTRHISNLEPVAARTWCTALRLALRLLLSARAAVGRSAVQKKELRGRRAAALRLALRLVLRLCCSGWLGWGWARRCSNFWRSLRMRVWTLSVGGRAATQGGGKSGCAALRCSRARALASSSALRRARPARRSAIWADGRAE